MSHQVNDMILEDIGDEISCMDRADKVNFLRDYYGGETVWAMGESEMDEKIGELKFEELCR
jgi:hypothetical protein